MALPARMEAPTGRAAGDDERAEAADRDGSAVAQPLADAAEKRAQRALGGALGAAGAAGQDRDEVGAVHEVGGGSAVMTRATASSKTADENGFSMTGTPAPSRKSQASTLAVSPVMKMKRRASAGSRSRTFV